jgi:hypothetical protein
MKERGYEIATWVMAVVTIFALILAVASREGHTTICAREMQKYVDEREVIDKTVKTFTAYCAYAIQNVDCIKVCIDESRKNNEITPFSPVP